MFLPAVVSSIVDLSECAEIGANILCGAMAGVWSAPVLGLTVQLFDFGEVRGDTSVGWHKIAPTLSNW